MDVIKAQSGAEYALHALSEPRLIVSSDGTYQLLANYETWSGGVGKKVESVVTLARFRSPESAASALEALTRLLRARQVYTFNTQDGCLYKM